MFSFVVYIKSLACLLITNSHFNRIWPISAMATGGAIGNALFFMVAGFCLSRVGLSADIVYRVHHMVIRKVAK